MFADQKLNLEENSRNILITDFRLDVDKKFKWFFEFDKYQLSILEIL